MRFTRSRSSERTLSYGFEFGRIGLATVVVVLASCVQTTSALYGDNGFQWKFDGNMISTSINACQDYKILVQPQPLNATTRGTPPYYMLAFSPERVTTRSFIGTDPDNLTWTVNQAPGSRLLLNIADAQGYSGGMPNTLYDVAPGSTDSCITPQPSVNITIVTNVTNAESCQPVGVRVYGGSMPYNITISALNSTVVTNLTLGPTNDVLTYINRAEPNGEFLFAVSDSTGTWGASTPMIKTFGEAHPVCVGLVSSEGNSSFVDQHPAPPSKSRAAVIVLAVVIPIIVVLLALGVGMWYYRKRREQRLREPEPAFLPEAWSAPVSASTMSEGGGSVGGSALPLSLSSDTKARLFGMPQINVTGSGSGSGSGPSGSSQGLPLMANSSPRSASSYDASASSSTGGPASSTGAVAAAGHRRSNSAAKGRPSHGRGAGSGDLEPVIGPGGVRLPPGLPAGWQVEPQILIQHRDGGAVTVPTVQEIPPPYIDRGVEPGESSAVGVSAVGSSRPLPPTSGASGYTSGYTSGNAGGYTTTSYTSGTEPGTSTMLSAISTSTLQSSQIFPSPISTQATSTSPSSPNVRHPLPPIPGSPATTMAGLMYSASSPPQVLPPGQSPKITSEHPGRTQSQTSLVPPDRYSAPLPDLPGPIPPPHAPTGLPSSPASALKAQQQRVGQHSPHSSVGNLSRSSLQS